MESILVGLVGIVVGGLVALYGVRAFFVLLPLWAFAAGFVLGSDAVTALLGERFLVTALGWAAGIGLGILFAVVAGLWFWAAIVILAGTVGWALVAGILTALGLEPGPVMFLAGLAGAVALGVLAIVIDAPVLYVAALTAFGGAALGVAGALLVIGRIELAALDGGAVGALTDYPLAFVAWIGLAVAALVYQLGQARASATGLVAPLGRSA